ncbi:hypothetical protein MCANUF31_00528 [Mycoplasmopsis canis UF31]|nr:hypothetical protein MCANUF31_00528 [Mycoplasmopsis canis UF31]EIE40932.1 hypothetical protein MCANUF33_00558 [Mycoplasmopsis canis UF33]
MIKKLKIELIKMKFAESNYFKRKTFSIILLLSLFIIFVFQLTMIKLFLDRIDFEYEYIKSGELSKNWSDELVRKNSPTYELLAVFMSLNSVMLFLTLISLILISIVLYKLFKNQGNGDLYLRVLTWIIPVIFILLFFIISLQPVEVYKENIGKQEDEFGELVDSPVKEFGGQFSYILTWISMFLGFFNIFFVVLSRKSFGFITKDQILAKKSNETENLKKLIEAKLENR